MSKPFFITVKRVYASPTHKGHYVGDFSIRGDLIHGVREWEKSQMDEDRVEGPMCEVSVDDKKQVAFINESRKKNGKKPLSFVKYIVAESVDSLNARRTALMQQHGDGQ